MIKIEDFKKSLGDLEKSLTESQIIKLRDQQDQMAEIFFNSFIHSPK